MKLLYKNILKIFNTYNSGKKVCIINFNKNILIILGFFLINKIIKKYFIILINNKKFIFLIISKIIYLNLFSKSSRKFFINFKNIKKSFFNFNLMLISTNFGILDIKDCLKLGIGGKIILNIL